jgi:hypothetical protein|tara:strand:+ start:317 stop:484 length:168 start_codon:yes stop_codon:yes gene_type:complete
MITYKHLLGWIEEIHEDTLENGTSAEQYVLEQLIHYLKNDYKEGKPLKNNNILGY